MCVFMMMWKRNAINKRNKVETIKKTRWKKKSKFCEGKIKTKKIPLLNCRDIFWENCEWKCKLFNVCMWKNSVLIGNLGRHQKQWIDLINSSWFFVSVSFCFLVVAVSRNSYNIFSRFTNRLVWIDVNNSWQKSVIKWMDLKD